MIKKLVIIIFIFSILFGTALTASASEGVQARLSTDVFLINDNRTLLRAYEINDQLFLNIFEIAIALNGTENQFFPQWNARQETLSITSGMPYSVIGFNLSRHVASSTIATPLSINLLFDDYETVIHAYRVDGDIFMSLRYIRYMLGINIQWNPATAAYVPAETQEEPYDDLTYNDTYDDDYSTNIVPPVHEFDPANAYARGIDPSRPMVALTFDDGPSRFTVPILDVLERYNVVGTFYVVGQQIEANPDVLLRTFRLGNEIANHTWSHIDLELASREETRTQLRDTSNAIANITGIIPTHMRPTFGRFNETTVAVALEFGYPMVRWSVDPQDWLHRDADHITDFILSNVADGDIILLHDLYASTAEATARIVPALIERGFQLVTVSELMYFSGITMQPGELYRDAR